VRVLAVANWDEPGHVVDDLDAGVPVFVLAVA
jgi:hypothetical protein